MWAEQKDVDLENAITPGWFATYGTPFRAGRDFDGRDTAESQPVAIVNEAYRRKHFPDRNPLGESRRATERSSASWETPSSPPSGPAVGR